MRIPDTVRQQSPVWLHDQLGTMGSFALTESNCSFQLTASVAPLRGHANAAQLLASRLLYRGRRTLKLEQQGVCNHVHRYFRMSRLSDEKTSSTYHRGYSGIQGPVVAQPAA